MENPIFSLPLTLEKKNSFQILTYLQWEDYNNERMQKAFELLDERIIGE